MNHAQVAFERLACAPAVWVTVTKTDGSVPRDAATWMAVFSDSVVGTIGGGHVELQAIGHARGVLAGTSTERARRYALGPSLGQCCGGVMQLGFETVNALSLPGLRQRLQRALTPLALFGGGHVGRALIDLLGQLPYAVTWIDSRDEIFPGQTPGNVACEHSDPVQAALPGLASGSRVLVMSFSHAEDLEVVAACLRRVRDQGDLPYVGLIGSKTKWAIFRRRLCERGFSDAELDHVTCPIGIPGIAGKEPEVIAIGVTAQLLQHRDQGFPAARKT